ncbi:hypothetical protein T492DRAFT_1150786 [Pavlovales sp. CCMP2436]|nr:hypothetical protein T492DRAFT_1150786 [Pavlovales sp. CCMP2436]
MEATRFEPGRVRPGSSARAGLGASLGSTRPSTSLGLGPPLTVADSAASQLGMLDDPAYFSTMRSDILLLQRRLRAFATPRKGAEVSEASLQLIVGGSNPLHAKVALHELLADKMMQLERALVQATADGIDGATPGVGGASRLAYYLVALDRLQRLHFVAADGLQAMGGGSGGAGREQIDELAVRVQERDRLNATLERELMELQSTLRVGEAEARRHAAGANALRDGDVASREEEARLRDAAARSADAAAGAQRRADALRAQVEELGVTVAELQARAAPGAAAKAAAREEELGAALGAAEAALGAREATVAGLKRALSEAEAKLASIPAPAGGARVAALEAELLREKAAARSASNYAQTRIDQLTAQLDLSRSDDSDKSMLGHMHAENERLQAEVATANDVLASVKRELDLVSRSDGDSFEAVMIDELRAMRESFEAKLAAVHKLAKDRQASHRKESRELRETYDKERASMEARIAYLDAKLQR